MDSVVKEFNRLDKSRRINSFTTQIESLVQSLQHARDKVSAGDEIDLESLQKEATKLNGKLNDNLKDVHSSLTRYSRAVEKVNGRQAKD